MAHQVVDVAKLYARQKAEKLELLNWVIKLCGSGMTVGMIRRLIHNKIVEIDGKGEKA
jgi:hypothetical protein